MTSEEMEATLQERFEQEWADRTGQVDYASLLNGAKILSSSRSYKDTLPVLNRLLHIWGLKFYGHGPDAALLPTVPPNALGQCWSFRQRSVKEQQMIMDDEQQSKQYDYRPGSLATLEVSLAQKIRISSVRLEHTPAGSKNSSSAIRSFRIIGFTFPDATSPPLELGSFEFTDLEQGFQEFKVSSMVPLRAISLAMDSQWGSSSNKEGEDLACLYRFRVHGKAV